MAIKKKKSMEELYNQIRSGNIDTSKIDFSDLEEDNNNSIDNSDTMEQVYSQIRSGNIDMSKIDFGDKYDKIEEKDTSGWFKKSNAFEDDEGNILTDTGKTVLGTVGDAGTHFTKGIMKIGEGIGDTITYGRAQYNENKGNTERANELRQIAQRDSVEELFNPIQEKLDRNSILGDESDNIVEGLGYVAGMTAIGAASGGAATFATTATTFTSSMGEAMNEAYEDGANNDDVWKYGVITGLASAIPELMFGGLGKASGALGLSKGALPIDDVLAKKVSSICKTTLGKNLSEYVIKAGAEGTEEVVSGFFQAVGQKLTYKSEEDIKKLVKDQNLLEQFFSGAIISAIAQVPGQNGIYKTTKNGRDFITGLTQNEAKVYDKELSERTNKKTRETAIEKAYNEQIATQEKLGINLTNEDKATIRQAVEEAYNSGRIQDKTEISSKEYEKIENSVKKDLEDGNISIDRIRETLGENQDITKDTYLQKSYYEEQQKGVNYQVEKTDNEKVNILYQSAADAGMNNNNVTRRKVELVAKLTKDTNRQYKFVSPEQLKSMGYNENANGIINKETGEILINSHSDKGLQAIIGHETTHIFDSTSKDGKYTKEYEDLQKYAIEYAKEKGIYEDKVKSITNAYSNILKDEKSVNEELTADLVGDFLFNDEKFIENLSTKNRNVFQKIYDYIKHSFKLATAGSEEAKQLENLKYQFDKVFKTISEEANTEIKYHVSENFSNEIDKVLNNELKSNSQVKARDYTPKILVDNGIQDLPMLITQNHIKSTIYTKQEAENLGLSTKNINYHGLGKDLLIKAIDNLDNPQAIYKTSENNYLIVTEFKDNNGKEIIVPIQINGKGRYNDVFIDENQIKSVYGRNNLDNYINSNNFEQIYKKNEELDFNEGIQYSNVANSSINNSIALTNKNVNDTIKYSMSESENNSGSFSFEKTAKRYEDLLSSNTLNYNKRDNGTLNIEMYNGKELINQFTVGSKEEAIKQLGNDISNYIYENANENFQTLNLKQQDKNNYKPVTHKEKQLDIINKTNPMLDDYHTGIRKIEDIKTFEEAIQDEESFSWGDYSKEDAERDLKRNKVKVYSSYSIKNGTFVSTSYEQALEYAGMDKSKVYSKEIKPSEVAWINGDEGQYANINKKYSMTNDNYITGDDIAVKDMLKKEKNTIENEIGKKSKENPVNITLENTEEVSPSKEMISKYKQMEIGKREYEKLLRREKPTEKEKITVDRLLKGEIENNEIPASVNRQRVVDLYNAKAKFYNVEKEIKTQRKEIIKNYRDLAKNMTQNISNWKDKKRGIQYQVNTMKRNLRDIIPNKSEADALYNEYFKPITKNNAIIEKEINKYNERISKFEINNIESKYIQMIGENKYNPDTKLPIETIEEFYDKNKSKIDINKCQEAVEEFRKIYDELILKINDTLVSNGYKPVEYRQGYFPHFIEDKPDTLLGKIAEKFGWKINNDTLPTDIAGITDQFRPGKRWTSFSQQRKSDATDYNALKGYDNYIRGAMDVIYHTQDIQKLRALENEIRYQYSEKGIQEQIDNIYNDNEVSIEEKEKKINEIFDNVKNNPMGNLATELRNYTNNLANKKETSDRGMEQAFGRKTYSIMSNIQNRVSANMVGANISSAMTNFIPITQAWSQTSTKNIMKAMKESIAIQFKDDGFSNNSIYLTNRTEQADRLYKTGLDKVNDKLGYMFDIVDSFTSNVIVRAKYYDNIDLGMNTAEAMENADEFAKDVMAGRSKGDMPTIFNKKNPLVKLFTAFQLEVNNQYGYMLKDIPADLGGEAKEKLVAAFVKMFLGAFLYNMLSEKITGRKSAFSPIDIALDSYNTLTNDEMSSGDKINSIATDLVEEAPFIGGIAGGGRLPIQGAIPYDNPISMFSDTISNASDFFDGNENQKQTAIKSLMKEWSKPLYYIALPFAGGQLKKTIDGASMYLNDVPGSYSNNGDLRYTVDEDIGSKVQAAIFGAYANPYAQDYVDSGYKTIKSDNIDEMVGLGMNSTEYRNYKKGLSAAGDTSDKNGYKQYIDDNGNIYWYDSKNDVVYNSNYEKTIMDKDDLTKVAKTQEQLNYIDSLDISDEKKTIMANNLNKNSKKKIDMSEYGNYDSYEEYKYARDYPEKYSVISQISSYDDFQEYSKQISNIAKEYKELSEDATTSKQKTAISKQKKQEIQSYIESLPLNQYQKIMLEKEAGGYSIKNYKQQIYQYLESQDLTNEEKYNMWKELFE